MKRFELGFGQTRMQITKDTETGVPSLQLRVGLGDANPFELFEPLREIAEDDVLLVALTAEGLEALREMLRRLALEVGAATYLEV
jgi:hypothetical protein